MKTMPPNTVDNSKFPPRRVVKVRNANPGSMSVSMGIALFATLECGHEVGVKAGVEVPATVPCYWCDKETSH